MVACLDSKAALMLLAGGAAAQTSAMAARLWTQLRRLEATGRTVHLQWVPAHCGLPGNEERTPWPKRRPDLTNRRLQSTSGPSRGLSRGPPGKSWQAAWPQGWYRAIMADRAPRSGRSRLKRDGGGHPPSQIWPLGPI